MRGRNNNRNNNKGPNPLTKSYESNGPDVKIRGTAQHIAEKYSQLARDALSSGDPVAAENYFQHAEHYFRIIAAAQEQLREQYGYQQRPFDEEGAEDEGFAQGERSEFGNGEDGDFGTQPQPYENRGERQPRFDRGERQDRGDRPERGERPDRGDRQERNDRQDRRDRFQRDRGPRQDFQRDEQPSEGGERNEQRPARFDRQDRGDRPDRGDRRERFQRDRRREEADGPEQATLPAFLTNPVRAPAPVPSVSEDEAQPVVQEAANDEAAARPRRRRRTRQEMIEANGDNAGFAPDPVETPAAE